MCFFPKHLIFRNRVSIILGIKIEKKMINYFFKGYLVATVPLN